MKIGLDGRFINNRYHGIGRYAFRMYEELARDTREFSYVVYRGKDLDERFDWSIFNRYPNVEVKPFHWSPYLPSEQLIWPIRLLKDQVKLFFSPYFSAPIVLPKSISTIVTVHDLIFDRYPEYMPLAWIQPYYRMMMQASMANAAKIVCVSRATLRDLYEYYPQSSSKTVVIGEGVDPEFKPIDDPAILAWIGARYGLERPFILAVGTRRPHKNYVRLVEAYAHSLSMAKHDLVFVGPADNRFPDHAKMVVESLGIGDQVKFLDWVDEADLPALYSLADLVVLPSIIEGYGLPALEAMACGTMVIGSWTTSIPEVIGEAGLYFDPKEIKSISRVIDRALGDVSLRSKFIDVGLRRMEEFRWPGFARQLETLFKQVLA